MHNKPHDDQWPTVEDESRPSHGPLPTYFVAISHNCLSYRGVQLDSQLCAHIPSLYCLLQLLSNMLCTK